MFPNFLRTIADGVLLLLARGEMLLVGVDVEIGQDAVTVTVTVVGRQNADDEDA